MEEKEKKMNNKNRKFLNSLFKKKMNKKGGLIAYFFWISVGIAIGMFMGIWTCTTFGF